MKKIIAILVFALIACMFLVAAPTLKTALSKGVQIYGYIDQYCLLYVTPIEATSNSSSGIPFSIEDSTVTYNSADVRLGREIGTWSFATNMSSVTLTFNAGKLTHEDDDTYQLGYYITFRYAYDSIDVSGNTRVASGYMTIHSGEEYTETITNDSGESDIPVISMDKDVRLMFDQNYDVSNYPAGYYTADVVIQMEAN